jgi:hypothetical protein
MVSVTNCLAASMAGFLVGGSFVSLALNDITWLTFALLASLDRMTSGAAVHEPVTVTTSDTPLPRVVGSWRPPGRAAARLATGHARTSEES